MNKTYRLVWSDVQQAWVVTHEHVKSRGKRSSGRVGVLIAGALLAPALHAAQPAPNALPTGGQVVAGQAAISQAGSTMNIQQATQKAILNWQSFNIGANATVNFQQPSASAVALNRVIGQDPSAIFGNLNANGQVFLVNPNGVLFGPGARVDVGGLVATTMNIRNEDFLAGNYRFFRDGATGSVINRGNLTGGYLALLAPEVRNEGVILARMGTAALAGGDAVTLGITGENRVDVRVDKATINTLVENRHLIQVDGGRVVMSAQSAAALLGRVVNNGSIEANSLVADGGSVRLDASHTINHSGSISANAGTNGRGGEVIVIADLANPASRTDVSGSISARGGSQSGNGGFIETSANKLKIADSAVIDTRAPFGVTGQWLLDPYDFTIAAANGDITGAALGTALASNNVTIQTLDASVSCTNATCGTGNSSGNGDIFVNDSVTWASDKTLTLSAWRNIHINAPVNVNGSGGGLALHFAQSDTAANFPTGIYTVSAPVNLAAGATFSTKAATDGPVINYTVIRNATQLAAISSGLAGNYVLGTDITAPVTSWTPIGNTATPFMGIFDGLGHKVTGLQHTNAGADVDVGLFGNVGAAGLIQNVGVTNVNIAGSQNVGALAGFNNGFIVNSYATGTVQGTGTGDVGRIGGLVGFSPGPIQSSYANVTVTATSGNQTNDPLMMENPLSTGRGGIGGLAGVVGAAVGDSYARGNVTGINAVGGLVGFSGASISSSYSTGAVSGTTNAHGLVGQVFDPMAFTPFIFNSFWDTTTSGQITGGGGAADLITGLATAQMQTKSTFDSSGAGWDTNVAWELRNGQYPLLKPMLQPVYVIADNKTASFTNTAFTAFTSTTGPTGTPGGATTGTVTFTPSTANPTNAGTYTVTPGGVSVAAAGAGDQHGYRVEFVNGTLTITPAVLTTTITGSLVGSVSKVYDGSSTITGLTNANFSLSGWQGSDGATVTKTTGTITDGPNASASTTRPVTVTLALSDYTPTGSTLFSNYTLPTSVSGNIGQISPKTVTLSATKTYDGSTTLTGGQVTITTGVAGEALTYSGATANSKNVVDNATNFISAITLLDGTGGLASNYQKPVLNAANAPVTINKADLVLNGTRVYDATTVVAGSVLTATGVNGESFAMTGAGDVTNLASKNVVTNGALSSVTGLSLGASNGTNPADASNYNAPTITGSSVTISKLTLGVSAPPAPSAVAGEPTVPPGSLGKVYDGTSVATVTGVSLKPQASSGTAPSDKPYFGDAVSLTTASASGQFQNATDAATANVADASKVVITGLTLSGADSGNYELPATVTLPGVIRQRTVTLSATKTYDGTTTLTGSQITIGNRVGSETLNYTGATANSKDVADNGSNFISAITLANGSNGGLASNYRLPTNRDEFNAPVTINKANLVLSGTRVYDATTVVAGSVLTATGVNSESFAVTGAGDATNLASRNVVTNGALSSVAGLALGASNGSNPADAGNYNPITVTGSQVTITRKTLDVWTAPFPSSIGGVSTVAGTLDKVYNGSAVATLSDVSLRPVASVGASPSIGQPFQGDDVSLNTGSASGQYRNAGNVATANVADATTVVFSGLALSGADSGNYQLPASPTMTGRIVPKAVTLTAPNVSKTYDGGTSYTTQAADLTALSSQLGVAGDTVTAATIAFTDKNASIGDKTVNFTAHTISSGNSNYTITRDGNSTSTINKAPLTVTADNQSRSFGAANPVFTQTITGFVGGETLATSGVTGSAFGSSAANAGTNVGTAVITASAAGLSAANYDFTNLVNGTLTITPAVLSILNTDARKTYDGTNIFNNTHSYTFTGMVNGDLMPSVTSGEATVSSKNAGTYNSFVTNSLVLSNSNYTLSGGTVSATINPKVVTLTAPSVTKTYDGGLTYTTQAADLTALSNQLGVAGDTVTAATIAFTDKNAGSNKSVTFSAHTISDGNGGNNYTITRTGNTTSTINKANLTLSGSRVYDGTTVVAGSILTANGVNGETFSVTGTGDASNLASRNVVTNGTLNSVTGLSLGASNGSNPADAGNYNPITFTGSQVTITKKTLDVMAPPAPSQALDGLANPPDGTLFRVYDGSSVASTTGVTLKSAVTVGTVASGQPFNVDTVSLDTASASGQFRNASNAATANVADATTVAITGLALSGADSGNYQLPATVTMPGAIQRRTVTLSATKTYDGTAALTGNQVTIGNLVSGETLSYRNATSDQTWVTYNSSNFIKTITLDNGDNVGLASNYRLPQLNRANAPVTINKADLIVSGSREYDGTDSIYANKLTVRGVNDAESISMVSYLPVSLTLPSRHVVTNIPVSFVLTSGGCSGMCENSNYNSSGNALITITPRPLTITGLNSPTASQLTVPSTFTGQTGQSFNSTVTLSGTPTLKAPETPVGGGLGSVITTTGAPFTVDGPLTITGTATASTWTATNSAGGLRAPVTGLTLSGTGASNYTLTGNSVSAEIRPSAAALSQVVISVIREIAGVSADAILKEVNNPNSTTGQALRAAMDSFVSRSVDVGGLRVLITAIIDALTGNTTTIGPNHPLNQGA